MSAVWSGDVLGASQVRVYSAEGVVGAGFLVSSDVVCTCAHVVAEALGVPADVEELAGAAVDLEFPLLAGRPHARAVVVSWRRGSQDVALLRLDGAVDGARSVPLVDGSSVWGHAFRTFGYPAGADRGVWASGTLRAGQGAGWVQMEVDGPGPRVSRGFSGAPVWDNAQDGVVGMTIAAHLGESTAYLLPSAELVDEQVLRPRCPFLGLEAFTEDHADVFRGRDADTERVYAAVRRRTVTVVAGPSGCGKSSLVRAGVLPLLRHDGASVTELRPVPGVPAPAVLARALTGILEPELGEVERIVRAEQLARLLEAVDNVPDELRASVLALEGGADHVLFIDQLEEYAAADPEAARKLLGLLTSLAGRNGTSALRVVATARPDSLGVLVTSGTSDVFSEAVQFLAPLAADGLNQAVTGPVDAVAGLWFEPGLPERIVADAGDEPGRMPLVQFALTELWNRRTRSMLTHAAYDDLGGVAGALVGYADNRYAELDVRQQVLAKRLFVQLARPREGGSFSRRPTRSADLAPELLAVARQLAPGKLLVLSRGPSGEGEEIVDLAHEALTRLWPHLRQWLEESRDFRQWQEQLRADLCRWQSQGSEPSRLLSGADLTEADRRLAGHPADVSPEEHDFVRQSRRHSRRGARIKRAAVTSLALLTVLAVVLALSTWHSLRKTEDQLRTQAAGLLAQAAENTPGGEPATALQLALAAWNTRQTPKTRDALMHQYARNQYLVGVHPSVWRGRILGMDATPDARTLMVMSAPSKGDRKTFTLVQGILGGTIRTAVLGGVPTGQFASTLSPDGRYFAMAGSSGVRLWDLSRPKDPVDLDRGTRRVAKNWRASMDFSSDSRRLLLTMGDNSIPCYNREAPCVPPFAVAWKVPTGDRLPVADALVSGARVNEVAFATDPTAVALVLWNDEYRRVVLKDLVTGRLLHRLGTVPTALSASIPILRDGGDAAVSAQGRNWRIQRTGRVPGPPKAIKLPGESADATGRYDLEGSAESGAVENGGYAESALTDVQTGQVFRTRLPTSGRARAGYTNVAAAPRQGDGLNVIVPVGNSLMVVRAEPSHDRRFQSDESQNGISAASPDGRYVARATGKALEILDTSRARLRTVRIPDAAANKTYGWAVSWTADSKRVVLWDKGGSVHSSYAVPSLRGSVSLRDASKQSKGVDSVIGLSGSEILVLTADGMLTRLDAARGTVLSKPFLSHPGPNSDGPAADLFSSGQLLARPEHSGQVAVVTRAGGTRGEIMLWDIRTPRKVTQLAGQSVSPPGMTSLIDTKLAFTATGDRLAVVNSDGEVRVWDIKRRKPLPGRVSGLSGPQLIGFTPDGSLAVYVAEKKLLEIHDLANDSSVTLATGEGIGEEITQATTRITPDGHLIVDSGRQRRTFDLRPESQFRTLCSAANRDYTTAERKLLPEGTPPKPPCS
ncbi:AAA family ATPase [Streptomyces sp. NPDC057592]|uniref:nSTAND1 domain-containing NTPase n=1 Tax=unclassified Streptomyces TaxID=2593676 RepID=UPI0036913508